jgi:hypothetical protein
MLVDNLERKYLFKEWWLSIFISTFGFKLIRILVDGRVEIPSMTLFL